MKASLQPKPMYCSRYYYYSSRFNQQYEKPTPIKAHIALQESQAFTTMLHRMAFCLSGKVVALHLDNSTAKAYLCNEGGTVSPFLSRLACQILSLTNKDSISLMPVYIPTHVNVEANYLSRGQLLPEWHLLPQMA